MTVPECTYLKSISSNLHRIWLLVYNYGKHTIQRLASATSDSDRRRASLRNRHCHPQDIREADAFTDEGVQLYCVCGSAHGEHAVLA